MNRKIKVILLIILIGTAGYFAWQVFSNKPSMPSEQGANNTLPAQGGGVVLENPQIEITNPDNTPPGSTGTQEPALTDKPIQKVSQKPAIYYWINQETNSSYYLGQGGDIYLLTANGEESISSANTGSIKSASASPRGNYLLIEISHADQSSFSIFSLSTKSWKVIANNITTAAWGPDEKTPQVAYIQKNDLYILDVKTAKSTFVTKLTFVDVQISWKNPKEIYITTKPSAYTLGSAWALDINKKTLRIISQNESGLIINWGASGKIGLKFTGSINKGSNQLSQIDVGGAIVRNEPVITLPQKCLITDSYIYCATPLDNALKNQVLDTYLQSGSPVNDKIILTDLTDPKNQLQTSVYAPDEGDALLDAWGLQKNGNTLYFINRADGYLYSLNLQQ
jgi:hypothetical protein